MMNYEEFKQYVTDHFMDFMPDHYRDRELQVHTVMKTNRKKDAISLFGKEDGPTSCVPNIYINDMYETYKMKPNLQFVMIDAAHEMVRGFQEAPKINTIFDKKNIVFRVVNTAQNEEMLKNAPHREFLDLSVTYRWVAAMDEVGMSSGLIDNQFAENLGLSEEQLFKIARENTERLFPTKIMSMEELLGAPPMGQKEGPEMFVLTNFVGMNGATNILYEDKVHELAMELGSDLYLLPSSIHEWMAVTVKDMDINMLTALVKEVNQNIVALEERLSNEVYHYDKDQRKFSVATDVLNKELVYDMDMPDKDSFFVPDTPDVDLVIEIGESDTMTEVSDEELIAYLEAELAKREASTKKEAHSEKGKAR